MHCAHCADHEHRILAVEIDSAVRDKLLAFGRWLIPIMVTATGILVAASVAVTR